MIVKQESNAAIYHHCQAIYPDMAAAGIDGHRSPVFVMIYHRTALFTGISSLFDARSPARKTVGWLILACKSYLFAFGQGDNTCDKLRWYNFYGNRALELTVRCFVLLDGEHHLGELGNRIVLINNIYIDIILYAVTNMLIFVSIF